MGESLRTIMDGKLEENGKEQMRRMIIAGGENKELEQQRGRAERATRQMG